MVLRGTFDIITFDNSGRIQTRYTISAGSELLGYETQRGTWHTLIARSDGAAFLEVKEGPYDPETASEFAPWAPAEGETGVPQFLEWLRMQSREGAGY